MLLRLGPPFHGIAPRIDRSMLPDGYAQIAHNCKFEQGNLRPFNGISANLATLGKTGLVRSLYLYENSYWLHWTETPPVHVVPSLIASDPHKRLYWSRGTSGYPQMADFTAITSGGTSYPMAAYRLGLPAPTSALTWTVQGTANPDPPETGTQVDRLYVYTFVSSFDEESVPSPASSILTIAPGQHAHLTFPSAQITSDIATYNVTKVRVYRSVTSSTGDILQLVGEVAIASVGTTFDDTYADTALGSELTSTDYYPPATNIFGLCSHPSGALVGFRPQDVCFSRPYIPHAWPLEYRYPALHGTIMGGGVFGTSVLVLTDDIPFVLTGSDPSAMTAERIETGEACVSARSIVDMGDIILYASANGLIAIGIGTSKNLTWDVLGHDGWQAFAPSSITGCQFMGRYYGFYDDGVVQGGFVFDPATGNFSTIGHHAYGVFYDSPQGRLFYAYDDASVPLKCKIREWDSNTSTPFADVTWSSKRYVLPAPVSFGCAQVIAEAYTDIVFKVYRDGTLIHTQTVTSSNPFRLPAGKKSAFWEFEITNGNIVTGAYVATTMAELGQL